MSGIIVYSKPLFKDDSKNISGYNKMIPKPSKINPKFIYGIPISLVFYFVYFMWLISTCNHSTPHQKKKVYEYSYKNTFLKPPKSSRYWFA